MIRTMILGIGLVCGLGPNSVFAQPGGPGGFGREGHGSRGPGHAPKTLDVDSNGLVSLDEFLAPAQAHFATLDSDSDGSVVLAEFVEPPVTQFGELDADGDGVLTQDELRPPRPNGTNGRGRGGERHPPRNGMGHDRHHKPMLDTDSNGLVSVTEFIAPAEEHFANLDSDGDGLLPLAEFVVKAETRFGELDANEDGQIGEDEFPQHRPCSRGMRGEHRRGEK